MTTANKRDEAIVAWDDWLEQSVREALVPDPVPLHEREEGLLDEEILPLQDDWMKGPKGVVQSHHVR